MSEDGRAVALVVALAGSLKGISEIIRSLRARPSAEHDLLAERLADCQAEALRHAEELAKALGAPLGT